MGRYDEDQELVKLDCEFKHETNFAVKLDFGLNTPVWVPKSLIGGDPAREIHKRMESITVRRWFARREGLI